MFALNRIILAKGAALALGFLVATPLWSADFSFTNGTSDGLMGAASRRASPGKLETETADDFTLDQTTIISRATIVGLVPSGTLPQNVTRRTQKAVSTDVQAVITRFAKGERLAIR
jgi:hypothetical protein